MTPVFRAISALCLALIWTFSAASAQDSPPDPAPREVHQIVAAHATQPASILVLGTDHLSGWPALQADWLTPLNDALVAWAPDIILIERPTAWQAELYAAQDARFTSILRRTVGAGLDAARDAQAALDLSAFQAELAANRMTAEELATDPVRMTLLLAAAFDDDSAAMHWALLSAGGQERLRSAAPVAARHLQSVAASRNETQWIAARIARRLGHARLFPFDDQIEKAVLNAYDVIDDMVASGEIEAVLETEMLERLRDTQDRRPDTVGEIMDWFRFINGDAFARLDAEAQWGSFLAEGGEAGAARVALWETRNLRMAANVREFMAQQRARRVLVVVGSAHRAWLEAVLSQQSGVEIVSLDDVLN